MNNSIAAKDLLLTSLLILACTSAIDAIAEPETKDRQAVHHMQLQLRAAQQQNADLSAQVDTLKKQLSELEAKRAALEKKLGGQTRQISELSDKQSSDKQQLAELADKYKLLEQQNAATGNNLQQTQIEKEQLDKDVQSCENKNTELYQLSIKLMDKYQAKGVWDAMLQAEPLTQLEKVKMENLLQEYHDKADANRISPAGKVVQDTHP